MITYELLDKFSWLLKGDFWVKTSHMFGFSIHGITMHKRFPHRMVGHKIHQSFFLMQEIKLFCWKISLLGNIAVYLGMTS